MNYKKTLIFCFLLTVYFFSIEVNAQKVPMKFGKPDPEQFALLSYDKDTSAQALILGDYGESKIEYNKEDGFIVNYTRHYRAKIFKKASYYLATQSIILYRNGQNKDELYSLKAKVYNMENGKIVESELGKDMVHEDNIDNKRTEVKFTLPNVREGSIIEYTYTIRSTFWTIPDWQFQYTIPALWSEYRVSYPEYFDFKKLQKGYLAFDVNENFREPFNTTLVYREETREAQRSVTSGNTETNYYQLEYLEYKFRWVINNVPAFREEPYMNALINYLAGMEFELASYNPPRAAGRNYIQTWEQINFELLSDEDFGLQLNRGLFKDAAEQIKKMSSDPTKQMIAAYNFIRNRMKWDGRNRIYVTQSLRSAYDKQSGSSADINLMLVNLLNELDIITDPVLISTRNNGMIHPAQVMVNQFNYVIASAKIGDKTYLLDATEKMCPYNVLMPRCINGQGRIISEKRQGWIDISGTQRYEYTNMVKASIGEDGIIKGNYQRLYGNYAALEKRIEIGGMKDKEEYIRSLEDNNNGLTISNFLSNNLDSINKSYDETFDVTISNALLVAGDIISINPLLEDQLSSNPFKLEDRKFPVDYIYPRVYKDIMIYNIPVGYVVDEKPADIILSLPDGSIKYTFKVDVKGNTVQISSIFNIGKTFYTNEEYALLKEFYSNLVKKQTEKIVLKKSI